jgi:hypothetical protein
MRTKITIVLAALIVTVGLARGHAWAMGSETPAGGLTGTVHDFTNGFSKYTNTTTVGQCTFCHTPHGAITTSLLWNHELSGQTYSWDTTATMAGTPFPKFSDMTWTGPTAKCLSCHDGTVAIGAVNWFDAGHGGAGAWTGTPSVSPWIAAPINLGKASLHGLTANTSTGQATLSGIHPVAMPYPWNGQPSTYNGVTTGGNIIPNQWQTSPPGNIRIYMETAGQVSLGWNGASATTPVAATGLQGAAGIECSSCHDVHNKITADGYLLVGLGTGKGTTYLCNMCHMKY